MDFIADLFRFLKERKKWWLTPIILLLIFIGVLIVIGGGSAVAPFIYTLFQIVQNQDRFKTILVIVIGFTAIGWFIRYKWGTETYLDKIAFGIGAISIFIPPAAKAIEWAWLKFALALGWINSRILLSVIYFVFLLPIAWLSRLFTKDPLMLKARGSSSLYATRNHQYTKDDLENIW